MAGAGRVTLKLTTSEDHAKLLFTRDFRSGFVLGASLKVAGWDITGHS